MSDKSKKPKNLTIKHPCADLVGVWSLPILLDLEAWKKMSGIYNSYTGDGDIIRAIGLGHLEDSDIEKDKFLALLNAQQVKFNKQKVKTCPLFKANEPLAKL